MPLAALANFIPDHPSWATAIAAAGGLALLLGGMGVMGEGMRRLAGGRARRVLERLTGNAATGAFIGFAVTAIIHSSGATAMLLISLVEAGALALRAAIPVVLGATVGTTLTAQLLALRMDWLIPASLAAGVALKALPRRESWRAFGETVYGLGLLLLGLAILSAALAPLRETAAVATLFEWLVRWPVAGLPIGIAVTVMVQSSTASTGILIGLASQGLVPLVGAIHFILGAHIGSCTTGLLAALGTRPDARRVAVVQTFAAVLGAALMVFWVPSFAGFVRMLSGWGGAVPAGAGATTHEIANAHTLAAVLVTLALLPFSGALERIARRLVRDGGGPRRLFYLDRSLLRGPVANPDVALLQVRQAVRVMADQVIDLARHCITPAHETSDAVQLDIRERAVAIHLLRADIVAFLNEIGRARLRQVEMDQGVDLTLVATELDAITALSEEALRLAHEQDEVGPFTAQGQRELEDFRARTLNLLSAALSAFFAGDSGAAKGVERDKADLSRLEETLRRLHLERLRAGLEASARTDALHLAWLELMRQVNSHAKRIARVLLEREEATPSSVHGWS